MPHQQDIHIYSTLNLHFHFLSFRVLQKFLSYTIHHQMINILTSAIPFPLITLALFYFYKQIFVLNTSNCFSCIK